SSLMCVYFIACPCFLFFFFFSSRRRHTRSKRDWSSDVCSSDLKYINEGFIPALKKSLNLVHGGFAYLLLQKDRLIAALDPNGIRALCIGRLENGAYVVASETCAVDIISAQFVRDVLPGELIVIDKDGLHIDHYTTQTQLASCSMEYIYLPVLILLFMG